MSCCKYEENKACLVIFLHHNTFVTVYNPEGHNRYNSFSIFCSSLLKPHDSFACLCVGFYSAINLFKCRPFVSQCRRILQQQQPSLRTALKIELTLHKNTWQDSLSHSFPLSNTHDHTFHLSIPLLHSSLNLITTKQVSAQRQLSLPISNLHQA